MWESTEKSLASSNDGREGPSGEVSPLRCPRRNTPLSEFVKTGVVPQSTSLGSGIDKWSLGFRFPYEGRREKGRGGVVWTWVGSVPRDRS